MENNYELVEDIEFIERSDLFNKHYYLLGSASKNSYIKMKSNTYEYAKLVIDLLKQNKPFDEILEYVNEIYPKTFVNVEQFVNKLSQSGLVLGYEKAIDDEMETFGISLIRKKFDLNSKNENKLGYLIYEICSKVYIVFPLIIASMVLTYIFFQNNSDTIRPNSSIENFLIDTLITLILTGLCFLLHELGHAISAINNNIKIKSFSFGLYLGIIPTFYFHYYNLKIASSRTKFKVVIAGVYVNLLLSGISYILSLLFFNEISVSQILYSFSILNLLMVLANMLPTRLSDGYYIISLLFNKFDIRISFWKNIFYSQKSKTKIRLPLFLYFCFMVLAIIYTFVSIILKSLSYINEGNIVYGYGLIVAVSVMLLGAIINAIIKLHGVKCVSLNIFRQRIKIKTHRSNNIAIMLIIVLFTLVFTTGSSVYQNAKNHAINNYWNKTGNADIIAVFSNSSIENIETILENKQEIFYAYTKNTLEMIKKEKISAETIIAYTDISSINKQFNLNLKEDSTDAEVLLNSDLMKKLSCDIGDVVTLDGESYTIGAVSNKMNFFAPQQAIAVINSQKVPENLKDYSIISFVNYGHNPKNVESINNVLKNNNISFINQYDGSLAIIDEFTKLENILFILFLTLGILCLILIHTSFSLNIKNNVNYWQTLRMLGLTKKKMIKFILYENIIFSLLGILIGYFVGILLSFVICVLTETTFTSVFVNFENTILIIISGIILAIIPIFMILGRKLNTSPLYIIKPTKITNIGSKRKVLTFMIFIIGVLLLVSVMLIDFSDLLDRNYRYLNYIGKMALATVGIVLTTIPIMKLVIEFSGHIRSKIFMLSSYMSKLNSNHIIGLSTALVLCLVMIGTMLDFSSSFKTWAGQLADSQLLFDTRATTNNHSLGIEQMKSILADKNISSAGEFYQDIGKISNRSAYIITEPKVDNDLLQKIYMSRTSFHSLKNDEIIITDRLLSDLKINIGDTVQLSLNGINKKVRVVDSFETMDYSSYMVVVPNALFDYTNYRKYCANIKFNGAMSMNDLSNEYSNLMKFSSQSELVSQWKNSVVSSVDLILSMVFIVVISLMLMLRSTIKNSILDRKRSFAILRTMGVSKNEILRLLFIELSLFQLPTIFLSIVFSPIIAYNFVELNAYMTGYGVVYQFDLWSHLLIWLTIALIIFVIPIKIFLQAKNESPIDSIKNV